MFNGGPPAKPIEHFDPVLYHRKWSSGKINTVADNIINLISCFGDNKVAREKPDWIAESKQGKAARTNKRQRFLWEWMCPSNREYQQFLLNLIKETASSNIEGIHLDCIAFPRQEYCTCPRCVESLKESKLQLVDWRVKTVSGFVEKASKIVKGQGKSFSVTLTPDPYFARERYGEDLRVLSKYVDFFCVPLYDVTYSSDYWVETLAYGFGRQLEKPFYVWLYTADPGPKMNKLLQAIAIICEYVTGGIIFSTYDSRISEKLWDQLSKDPEILGYLDKRGCESITNVLRK